MTLALATGAAAGAVPTLGVAEIQAILLASVLLSTLALGLGAGLAAAAVGFAWLLWPAAEAGTLGPAALLRALLWFALAKAMAAAIALPRGRLARLAARLRGAEVKARQRGLLLDEMSHRIRNDMQRLTGMLQAQAAADPAAAAGLLRAAGRIQVLGRVHRRLARRAGGSAVDSRVFLEELAADLRAALLPDSGIALVIGAEAHPLPVAVAGDLGLVVNELVTNALKYAFPPGRAGTIRIYFAREDGLYRLTVADNGIGLPRSAGTGGSGTRLVQALAGQLGGRLDRSGGEVGGTLCELRFPVRRPEAGAPPPLPPDAPPLRPAGTAGG